MDRAMPTITEDADERKRLMKPERHPLKRQRLQMLDLIASKQAQTRTALAPLLGVNRKTGGDWLQLYADGGRETLLTIRTPPGKHPTIPAPVVAELRERLSQAEEETFRATGVEQVRAAVPVTNSRPLRLWSQDERRWGLMTVRRRRITRRGVKPVGCIQHQYANCWCFGCGAPATGEAYVHLLPTLDAANMQVFLESVAERHHDAFNILVLDRRGAHTAKALRIPETIALMFLPARSPERNPIERVWEDGRGEMAWKHFAHLDCLEDELEALLATSTAERLQSLSGSPYLIQAELAIAS
jgi:hypothetical protein